MPHRSFVGGLTLMAISVSAAIQIDLPHQLHCNLRPQGERRLKCVESMPQDNADAAIQRTAAVWQSIGAAIRQLGVGTTR